MIKHCKDCEFGNNIQNTDECGQMICSFSDGEYSVTKVDNECPYQIKHKTVHTCSDCSRFEEDTACMTQTADDEFANRCGGYIDKDDSELKTLMYKMFLKGNLTAERVNTLFNEATSFPYFDEDGNLHNKS